jgi:hypothetical protein
MYEDGAYVIKRLIWFEDWKEFDEMRPLNFAINSSQDHFLLSVNKFL